MTAEVIIAGGFVLLVVALVIAGGVMAFRSGSSGEKIDRAKDDAREAKKQRDAMLAPPLNADEQRLVLLRLRDRLFRKR